MLKQLLKMEKFDDQIMETALNYNADLIVIEKICIKNYKINLWKIVQNQ